MRVLYVIESLGVGGAERQFVDSLRELSQSGVSVEAMVFNTPLDLMPSLQASGIQVTLLKKRYKWSLFLRAFELAKCVNEKNIDIVHAHLYFPAICVALQKLMKLSKAKTFVTFHNIAYAKGANKPGLGLRVKKVIARVLYRKGIDFKLAVSTAVAKHYEAALHLSGVEVIHNAIDVVAIDQIASGISPDNSVALHLVLPGRLVHEKGHADFLYALKYLKDAGRSFVATIAGGGPLKSEILSEIDALGLGSMVSVTGSLSYEKMISIIASADIVVVPSRFEGFGLTAVEAMVLSKPVVASKVGGLVDIFEDEVNGLLVGARDPKGLACAIESLMINPSLREGLGAHAREFAIAKFSLNAQAKKLQRNYRLCLA